jgi:two-component system, sensor histidine kinase and response regulator
MNENIYLLIVDDNQDNLKVVSSILKELNYKIALAPDGESALKIVSANKFDLILLDIMMPGMDGFEVCRKLKEKPETAGIPVIFLTARAETEDVVKGFQLGGVDYVTKPFKKEELLARVKCHLQIKLVKDFLIKAELDTRKSRNFYMSTLYDLARIVEHHK